jgi:HSP20 family molecular chaperone IbpA
MYLKPLGDLNRFLNPDFRVGYHSFAPFPASLSDFFDYELGTYTRRFKATEENGNLILSLDLPGFKQAEVEVELENQVLTVRAKNAKDEVEQSVTVGDDIDPDKVEAKLEDGVLTLILGRHEAAKPRKITIK